MLSLEPDVQGQTLYIAGSAYVFDAKSTLATISFPSLVVTPVGPVSAGFPEMSGTGDGALWGFIPSGVSSSGKAVLVRIDPASGATLESHAYASLANANSWAMKFWGGKFWIFLGSSIYTVSRDTPDKIETAMGDTGRDIVGAGVSTCAPLR